jgi:hypothetical protein
MGKVLRLEDFIGRRSKVTLSLMERLGIADLNERNEEFMDFLARERARLVMKVIEINRIMNTISEEWGINLRPPDLTSG